MHLRLILLVLATCLLRSAYSAATSDVTTSATTAKPQGFAARSIDATDEEDEFESQAQTHLAYRQQQQPQQRQLYDYSQSEEDQEEAPRQIYQNRNIKQQSNYLKQNKKPASEEESEEEQEEEPDRLSQLLAKSSFNCNSKNSGYYADESLSCEVFHYCQDNQRHSWICPEGFTFHQIHLICMPPSHDNICQQSSKYHIVNDYLYKPINLQEHQSKPNVTLRYSERYYPENYYDNERYEDEEEAPRQRVNHQRQPVQVGFQQQHQQQQPIYQQPRQQVQQAQQVQQVRHQPVQPQPQPQQQQATVYRKPVSTTTTAQPHPQPQLIQPIQQRPIAQTIAPLVTPNPYRFFTAASPLHHAVPQPQVYRTPEEINISLLQRRPQLFVATSTPRYYEDDYLYERRK
ncbi:putative mediator of RNA polymerase II transcription subunit 26 [Anastrepha obliqua]|uniref:putative mediator of RNA polymerase II transcription subunit 26 n=1 Tax=Anastrepha obliqua TaxID=95512 RepID=UPI00240945F8|nr:putative mediator of RNA polymerase II transcription subunit 26 [Anastrepha obliqua]